MGGQAGSGEHVRMREPAFEQLHPLAVDVDVDLQATDRVRMRGREHALAYAGHERRDDRRDHVREVGFGHRRAGHAPQVELVRLADVQPVDAVAPPHQSGDGHQDVVGWRRGQLAQRAGNGCRGVRAQHPPRVDVGGRGDEPLHAVVAGGGVGEIAQRQGVGQLRVADGMDVVGHGSSLERSGWRLESPGPGRARRTALAHAVAAPPEGPGPAKQTACGALHAGQRRAHVRPERKARRRQPSRPQDQRGELRFAQPNSAGDRRSVAGALNAAGPAAPGSARVMPSRRSARKLAPKRAGRPRRGPPRHRS
jgi:hypothetical protein